MKIFVQAGHTLRGKGTGAVGNISESKENRLLSDSVVKWLKIGGATVYRKDIDESNDYLNEQTNTANKYDVDLAIQIHFNAGKGIGTETLYRSIKGKKYAEQINNKLSTLFKNRGAKHDINDVNRKLHWLSNTKAPAVLIETCFVDSSDTDIYKANTDSIGKLIAEGILNKNIESHDSVYKIVTGGFGSKENAEQKAEYLRKLTGWYLEVTQIGNSGDYCIHTGGFTGEEKVKKKLNALQELTGWWAVYVLQ